MVLTTSYALVRTFFFEQVLSPIWQGMLWGLGGVTLTYARNVTALARAQRLRGLTAKASVLAEEADRSRPGTGLSGWIARLGLTRLFS